MSDEKAPLVVQQTTPHPQTVELVRADISHVGCRWFTGQIDERVVIVIHDELTPSEAAAAEAAARASLRVVGAGHALDN